MTVAGRPTYPPYAHSFPRVSSIMLLFLFTPPFTLFLTSYIPPHSKHITLASSTVSVLPSPLTFVTLSFNQSKDDNIISHNCVVMSRSRHRLYIHTDNPTKPFCSLCTCIPFKPTNCTCPQPKSPSTPKKCPLCEKLHFVDNLITTLPFFVYLDTDLIILNPHFMDRLATRATDFDFLAAYGFDNPCNRSYGGMFNSGLFFIRRVAHWRQGMLITLMSQMGVTNDQNVISAFVYQSIQDWDTLSLQWHCRFLQRRNYTIPPAKCYTLHGRGPAIKQTLTNLNRTLLPIYQTP